MKHTKTPWAIYYTATGKPYIEKAGFTSMLYRWKENKEETLANAQFIVKACNAHEELVEACKLMLREHQAINVQLNQDISNNTPGMLLATQALATLED